MYQILRKSNNPVFLLSFGQACAFQSLYMKVNLPGWRDVFISFPVVVKYPEKGAQGKQVNFPFQVHGIVNHVREVMGGASSSWSHHIHNYEAEGCECRCSSSLPILYSLGAQPKEEFWAQWGFPTSVNLIWIILDSRPRGDSRPYQVDNWD